ncbi:bifunctional riboflavin kinase/FMN phosphatase-like [Syzygium oleosum]|uniref:bifunctional riboflavin kinase/FMN phosphatase-like n=1 Tax=Syzygium oleosum TaxID=219896 RepID=UPI0011D2B130|nr:bifunctional riboflavin kinase/FMN phosphatase-like [Syzygium oleosum]
MPARFKTRHELTGRVLRAMTCPSCNSCNARPDPPVLAVVLDLDGTLLDTEVGGKGVLKEFLGKYGKVLEEGDQKRLGKTLKESAIAMVTDYDLPLTPDQYVEEIVPMYRQGWAKARALPGAIRLIKHLQNCRVPLALASNSLREYIDAKISHQQGWKECFSVIVGSDDVQSGKPAPDIFIEAARRMEIDATRCLVIEDSLVGVQAAKAAKMKVVAVPSHTEADCSSMADSVLHSLLEFQPELWGLPPFDDWVNNALPIEAMVLSCQHVNGSFYEIEEEGMPALPAQAAGVYFGWAQVGIRTIFKAVVGIIFDSPSALRKLHLCSIDGSIDRVSDQHVQLSLVGFIRGFRSKDVVSMDKIIDEQDKSIASSSLELPEFAHRSNPSFV